MDDDNLVDRVAGEIIERHGSDVVPILRERAEMAAEVGDELAAETWRVIVDATERRVKG
jgi:hypothetical protein